MELSHLEFTGKASTALAFVSLAENGERTFSFCRKPSADLLYAPEQIDPGWFSQAFALHFCSVSLVDSPMRYAHLAAITAARERAPSSALTLISAFPSGRTGSSCVRPCGSFSP